MVKSESGFILYILFIYLLMLRWGFGFKLYICVYFMYIYMVFIHLNVLIEWLGFIFYVCIYLNC